jgi:hypothetical protein
LDLAYTSSDPPILEYVFGGSRPLRQTQNCSNKPKMVMMESRLKRHVTKALCPLPHSPQSTRSLPSRADSRVAQQPAPTTPPPCNNNSRGGAASSRTCTLTAWCGFIALIRPSLRNFLTKADPQCCGAPPIGPTLNFGRCFLSSKFHESECTERVEILGIKVCLTRSFSSFQNHGPLRRRPPPAF